MAPQPLEPSILVRIHAGGKKSRLGAQMLRQQHVTLTRKAGIPVATALSVLDDLSQWLLFSDYRAMWTPFINW